MGFVSQIAFSPDGRSLLVSTSGGATMPCLSAFDPTTWTQRWSVSKNTYPLRPFVAGDPTWVGLEDSGVLMLIELETGKVLRALGGSIATAWALQALDPTAAPSRWPVAMTTRSSSGRFLRATARERRMRYIPPAMNEDAARARQRMLQLLEELEHVERNRTLLSELPDEERVRFLVAAGKISRPTRNEQIRTSKAWRKIAHKRDQDRDKETRAGTEIRAARRADVFSAPPQLVGTSAPSSEEARELIKPRACYVCKTEFKRLHFFYDAMCPSCATLNYDKRFQTASLEGRVAIITGARIKIGFQAALKMLRAGARVIVTTRFPRDSASRFAREADFVRWGERLEVYGLDLRHSPSVEIFARYMTQTKDRLDILINNAAQTVRRPPGFYTHMLALESAPYADLSKEVKQVLRGHETCKQALSLGAPRDADEATSIALRGTGLAAWHGGAPGIGIFAPAQLSQIPCAYDDDTDPAQLFPVGQADADMQQVDLRTMNSWRMTLGDVPSPEMLEVQLVNAVAPFILVSKLKPLMMRHPTGEKHIVNVSAMEGIFSRYTKTDKHPHTNMAKAALNMMTLTSAPDYAKDGIFMNAVDTGWVTDEDPVALAARKVEMHDFQPPLDIVDGAARICDPFFSGLITGVHLSGKFMKDYAPAPW